LNDIIFNNDNNAIFYSDVPSDLIMLNLGVIKQLRLSSTAHGSF